MANFKLSVTSLSVELERKVDDGARMSRLSGTPLSEAFSRRKKKEDLRLSLEHLSSSCLPFRSQMNHTFLQEAFRAFLIYPLEQHVGLSRH